MFVLAAFTAVFGLIFTLNGASAVAQAEHIRSNGVAVAATVSRVEDRAQYDPDRGKNIEVYVAHLAFVTAAEQEVEVELPDTGNRSDHRVGEAVEIIYDRTDPTNFVLDRDDGLVWVYAQLIFGVVLLVVVLVLCALGIRWFGKDPRPFD